MIYKVQTTNYYTDIDLEESYLSIKQNDYLKLSSEEARAIDALAEMMFKHQESINEYTLLIPRDWARGESKEYLGTQERVAEVPHYELHIERQVGSWKNRRDTYIYLRLPKSKMLINIVLHMDGGVSFDKKFHKYVLREMDELDRRIILGFCDKYFHVLVDACYSDEGLDRWLALQASTYQASKYKKRIKSGSQGRDLTEFHRKYNGGFKPYEESSIFKNVVFLNS